MASDNHFTMPPPLLDSKPNPDQNTANQFIPQNPKRQAQQRIVTATPDWYVGSWKIELGLWGFKI
jgi:hypothetical protein